MGNSLKNRHNKNIFISSLPSWVIQYLGIIANLTFLVGAVMNLLYRYYERNGNARKMAGIVSYFIAFILFSLSGIMELLIDICNIRDECNHRGRYTSTNSVRINIIISILFSLGA